MYENEDELMEAVERAYQEEMLGPDEDFREVLERCLKLETDQERLERMLDLELEDYE
jgi:hypothetical protein